MATSSEKPKSPGFDLQQQINFLKKIEFFDNFDDHELKQFLAVSKWVKVEKGTQIIKENTRERAFYILVKGEVSVVKTVPGKKDPIELTTLTTGACFGEMSLVMDVKRTAGVITTRECFILMVEPGIINTSNVFLQLKFYKRFCEVLVSRLITANEKMATADKVITKPSEAKTTTAKQKDQKPQPSSVIKEKDRKPGSEALHEDTLMVLPNMPDKKDRRTKTKLQQLIKDAISHPYNPSIVAHLSPHLHGECESTRLLADIIQLDPVLSCKVLQIANSSYFRRSTAVATVAHSMITVGIKQIQEALGESIEASKSLKAFSGFNRLAVSFWQHSIIVARIAEMLKDITRVTVSADVYLAGLLHDIGFLSIDQLHPDFYPHLLDPESELHKDLTEAENAYIGINHGQAGAWYGESIGLPSVYIDVMLHHHNPQAAKSNLLMVALVHLADLFATARNCGLGESSVTKDIRTSFGWVILQDQHRPFLDVNVPDFVQNFNSELDNTWGGITDGLDF